MSSHRPTRQLCSASTKYPYITGICHSRRHTACAGEYAGTTCQCSCHRQKETERPTPLATQPKQQHLF